MIDTLFNISKVEEQDNKFYYKAVVDPTNHIFSGHFEGSPIVPGVCTLNMIKSCVADILQTQSISYSSIKECKFLSAIIPKEDLALEVMIEFKEPRRIYVEVIEPETNSKMLKLKANIESEVKPSVLIVIPTYNNDGTLAKVIEDVRVYSDNILVVNDGSTDSTADIIENAGVQHISYSKNKGKGYAIRQSFIYAKNNGFDYVITIDADGQHFASDIPTFIDKINTEKEAIIIGARNLTADNMPSRNTFANKFSNFWFKIETLKKLDDTQSGFRLYPINKLEIFKFLSNKYEFEIEVIVRAAWAGIKVMNVPIKVYYPPKEERVSHFRPLKDFLRISLINTFFVLGALLYYFPLLAIRNCTKENIKYFIERNITKNPEPNIKIAAAMGLGIAFGIIPIWGYQMIAAASVAHFLKLNKLITLVFSNISIPPMIPFILFGSFWTGSFILREPLTISFTNISFESIYQNFMLYIVGSFTLAIAAGITVTTISYLLLTIFKSKRNG